MKARIIFAGLMLLSLFCAIAISARAQAGDADFQQAVAAYQQSPSADNAAKVIRMAAAMDQLPPIPEEARRHFVRGTTLFKDAKSPDDYKQVVDEFLQAARIAPWWPDARFNWALAQEAAGDYNNAFDNVKLYLLFKLPDAEARAAQDKIYALEAKQEKAQKAKNESAAQPAVAPQQQSFEDLLKKIDHRNYRGSGEEITVYGRHISWCPVYFADSHGGSCPEHYNYAGLGGGCNSIEIDGYESTCEGAWDQGQYAYGDDQFRVTISEDGETIRLHWRRFMTIRSSTTGPQPPHDQDFTLQWFR